jgi:MFS family permease
MSLFTTSVFIGPMLGPIVSCFILDSGASWRWIFWVMTLFAGTCTLIVIPTIPETYAPVILMEKARRLRTSDPVKHRDLYARLEKEDWSFKAVISRTILRPFKMLALEPILLLTTLYTSVVYGLVYVCG